MITWGKFIGKIKAVLIFLFFLHALLLLKIRVSSYNSIDTSHEI